jgi:hypothetical protein
MPTHDFSTRRRRGLRWLAAAGVGLSITSTPAITASATGQFDSALMTRTSFETVTGTLKDGATYKIQMPENWNGTLAIYTHGLVFPGDQNPAETAPNAAVGRALLHDGVALAGSDLGSTGWAVKGALRDQNALVGVVTRAFQEPTFTIAWGESLGGMVSTALVERFPGRFDGAVPMCGVEAGGVGAWNHFLDSAFVFKTLLGSGSPFQLTGFTDPLANLRAAQETLATAESSDAGRARLALTAAVAQLPGAIDPSGPVAEPTLEGRFQARVSWMRAPYLILAFAERAELEARAGGNPSWNAGVDYGRLLRQSGQLGDVRAMYGAAGLSLGGDLQSLAAAPRIGADPDAVSFLSANVSFSGRERRPIFTLHNVADGALPSSHEQALRRAVGSAGRSALLRQSFAGRAGHCTFSNAEMVVAFDTLQRRVTTGAWGDTRPWALNRAALALGPKLNRGGGHPVPPAFVRHHPLRFPSPFVPVLTS